MLIFTYEIPPQNPQPILIITAVIAFVALAVLPMFLPDGSEKYSGQEREAAEDVLKNFNTNTHDHFPKFYLRLHVIGVENVFRMVKKLL